MAKNYREDFLDGPGGWFGWVSNQEGFKRFELAGQQRSFPRSPWWKLVTIMRRRARVIFTWFMP